jgi:KUP system potassium uptake protein
MIMAKVRIIVHYYSERDLIPCPLLFQKHFSLLYVLNVVVLMHSTCAGGTVALYSHLCRNAKFSLLPNHQASDEELSTYRKPGYSNRNIPPSSLKRFIEKHKSTKIVLLSFVLLGACMVICYGALMPAISGKATSFSLHKYISFV